MREKEREIEEGKEGGEGARKTCRRIDVLFYLKILKRGGNSSKEGTYSICLVLQGV